MTHYHDFEIENERLRPLREEALKLHFEYIGIFDNIIWLDEPNLPSTEEGLLAYIEKRKLDIVRLKSQKEMCQQEFSWKITDTMDKPAACIKGEPYFDGTGCLQMACYTALVLGVLGLICSIISGVLRLCQ